MSCKSFFLRHSPVFLIRWLRDVLLALSLLRASCHDYVRFLVHSGINKNRYPREACAARITLFAHQVEKGLSLANPRPGFGMAVIPGLLDDIDTFIGRFGLVHPAVTALAALRNYLEFHARIGHPVEMVRERFAAILARHALSCEDTAIVAGGAMSIERTALEAERAAGFPRFFASRYSVRHFSGEPISGLAIRRAVEIAQKTPSVCNRQSWRVHAFSSPEVMARLLAIQSGSRGFGEQASALLVVTSELQTFLGVPERYQPWIDGGMFAMSLCLALHDQGYGVCCLNWSKMPHEDRALHEAADIPASEQIIMLLAVGTLPEKFSVARSYRPGVDHVLRLHGGWPEIPTESPA